MKANKIIRTLRQADRNLFKALNEFYGYNFEKPFDIYEVETPFTLGKVEKRINPRYTLNKYGDRVVVLICFEDGNGYRAGNYYGVEAVGTGAGDFNIGRKNYGNYRTRLDYFWRKSDFNDIRKESGKDAPTPFKVYVLCQHRDDLATCYKERTFDYSERLTESDIDYYKNRSYTFDKSGYRVDEKRRNLERQAKQLKAEREKARFEATDNTALIEQYQKRVELAKGYIIERLTLAKTSNDIRQVERMLSSWRGLGGAFEKLEELKAGDFDSVAQFNKRLENAGYIIDEIFKGEH